MITFIFPQVLQSWVLAIFKNLAILVEKYIHFIFLFIGSASNLLRLTPFHSFICHLYFSYTFPVCIFYACLYWFAYFFLTILLLSVYTTQFLIFFCFIQCTHILPVYLPFSLLTYLCHKEVHFCFLEKIFQLLIRFLGFVHTYQSLS